MNYLINNENICSILKNIRKENYFSINDMSIYFKKDVKYIENTEKDNRYIRLNYLYLFVKKFKLIFTINNYDIILPYKDEIFYEFCKEAKVLARNLKIDLHSAGRLIKLNTPIYPTFSLLSRFSNFYKISMEIS